jgi:hypothetical protein
MYCSTANQICCGRREGGDWEFACVSSTNPFQACGGGAQIRCDDRTDCAAGQVCCGAFDSNSGYRGVQCASSCNNSPIPGFQPVRFCDAKAPTDECAEIGKTCTPSGSLDGFSVCK